MITLYHSKDTRSLRCLWLLEELDLPYQLEWVAFPPAFKQPDFLQRNEAGTVPFLVDGDVRMRESCAILLYLAERYGEGRLLPARDSDQYGVMLDWTFYGEASLAGYLSAALRYSLFLPREQQNKEVAEDFRSLMIQRLELLSARLAGPYLCGDSFSVADISVGYSLLLGEMFGLAERYPENVTNYLLRLKARPALTRASSAAP